MPHYTSSGNVSGVSLSSDERIDALLPILSFDNANDASVKWGDGPAGTSATVTYSFPAIDALWSNADGIYSSANNPFSPQDAPYENPQALDATQQARFEAALAQWSAVANITFQEIVETPDGQVGDIRIAISDDVTQDGRDAWTFFPIDENYFFGELGGDIWLAPTVEAEADAQRFWIYLSNIGTAIGLDSASFGPSALPPEFDNWAYSAMSLNTGDSAYPLTPAGPMLYDILAIQYLYGPNMSWHTGNDVYDVPAAGTIEGIWDAGGIDTITAAGLAGGSVINLAAGTFSRLGPTVSSVSNLSIAFGATIENAIGSAGADTITGNDAANLLLGDAIGVSLDSSLAADHLVGNAGDDLIFGNAGGETAYGGSEDDLISGEGDADVIWGGLGNDFIDGGLAADTIAGEAGVDMLVGGAGGDTAFGGTEDDFIAGDDVHGSEAGGADLLYGDAGNDVILAGDGTDTVYGGADNDLVEAGAGDDVVAGDLGSDVLAGESGNDRLYGGDGNDSMHGGTGNDTLFGHAGNDTLAGGAGLDIFAFGAASGNDLIVDWETGDRIDVTELPVDSFGDLTIVAIAGGMRVTGGGLSVDVMLDPGESLGAGDFIFA